MIALQPSRTYIEVAGVKHYVNPKCVRMAELLLTHINQPIAQDAVTDRLSITKGSAHVYCCQIRSILKPFGYKISSAHECFVCKRDRRPDMRVIEPRMIAAPC